MMQLQQSPYFNSASLRANQRAANNSLRTAKNLGTIRVGQPFSFNVKSSLNPENRVQVYKYSLRVGVQGVSSARLTATGKGARLQVLIQVGKAKPQTDTKVVAKPGAPFFFNNADEFNFTGKLATFYLKFTPVKTQTKFQIQYVFSPTS